MSGEPMTASPSFVKKPQGAVRRRGPRAATRAKLDSVLAASAALIAEKGFEATSMRDVSSALGVSLAGLYHYFASKEELLYQIQYRTFASLLAAQEAIAERPGTPEERLRRLVVGHLAFFNTHRNELKVCTYELESLRGEWYHTTEALRRRYYRLMAHVLAELMGEPVDRLDESRASRHTALYVFGMLNWIFMWYDPSRHGSVEAIGEEMIDLVLHGIRRPSGAEQQATTRRTKKKQQ